MLKQDWMFSKRAIRIKIPKSGELTTSQISNNLQFWFLLIFGIFSLICSFFTIYRYLSNRTMRNGLHNHSILLLIIINVLLIITDTSWMLDSLRHSGRVPIAKKSFCLIWWFIDDSLYSIQTVILAWASIERHILIFHSKYVITKKQKIFYHYLPPIIIIIYLFSFHMSVVIFPPCINSFQFNEIQCGSYPCYLDINLFLIWDSIINDVLPTLIIAIFNIFLLYRIIAQKKRLQQPIQWRKHRRMSMQLISISFVYLFLNLPIVVIILVQIIKDKNLEVNFGIQLYIFFSIYSVSFSLPVVVCINWVSIDKHRRIRISPTFTAAVNKKSVAHELGPVG